MSNSTLSRLSVNLTNSWSFSQTRFDKGTDLASDRKQPSLLSVIRQIQHNCSDDSSVLHISCSDKAQRNYDPNLAPGTKWNARFSEQGGIAAKAMPQSRWKAAGAKAASAKVGFVRIAVIGEVFMVPIWMRIQRMAGWGANLPDAATWTNDIEMPEANIGRNKDGPDPPFIDQSKSIE